MGITRRNTIHSRENMCSAYLVGISRIFPHIIVYYNFIIISISISIIILTSSSFLLLIPWTRVCVRIFSAGGDGLPPGLPAPDATRGYWTGSGCDQCQAGYFGAACLGLCPGAPANVCGGRGTCFSGVAQGPLRSQCSGREAFVGKQMGTESGGWQWRG